jgi:hypothetical protein
VFFPWITANIVSYTGLILSIFSSKMVMSNRLGHRQFGAFLFELRNLADSIDGVVYRSNQRDAKILSIKNGDISSETAKEAVYASNYGTFGYNVDVICDGMAGIFLCVAILLRFLRYPPLKSKLKLLLLFI